MPFSALGVTATPLHPPPSWRLTLHLHRCRFLQRPPSFLSFSPGLRQQGTQTGPCECFKPQVYQHAMRLWGVASCHWGNPPAQKSEKSVVWRRLCSVLSRALGSPKNPVNPCQREVCIWETPCIAFNFCGAFSAFPGCLPVCLCSRHQQPLLT